MTPTSHRPACTHAFVTLLSALLLATSAFAETPGVTLPCETSFESAEGHLPGPLPADGVWTPTENLSATILAAQAPDGQTLSISGDGWLVLEADSETPGEGDSSFLWLDLILKPVFAENTGNPDAVIDLDGAAKIAFVSVNGQGRVWLLHGDGQDGGDWVQLPLSFPHDALTGVSADWIRLTLRTDYTRQSWDLYLNESPLRFDLGFAGEAASPFQYFALRGHPQSATLLDHFRLGAQNPLFEDSSGDGIPDAWLLAYGLDIHINQRDLDPDKDGLSNLREYLLGTHPLNADTDGDGLGDGIEVLLGLDPRVADSFVLGSIPFADGFESDTPGPFASGTRLWSLAAGQNGGGAQVTAAPDAPEGLHFLEFAEQEPVLSRFFNVTQTLQHPAVYVDMRLKVAYREHGNLDALEPYNRAAVFYVDPQGSTQVFSGTAGPGGQWFPLHHPPLANAQWARFTVRLDYNSQTWSIWVNNVRHGQHLGFRDPVPGFSLVQFDRLNALDAFSVAPQEPPGLDNDGDGLANTEELALGTNPDNPDTSGDGMNDGDKVRLGLDPLHADTFLATLQPDGQGGFHWHSSFSAAEGFTPGNLDGQNGWFAGGAEITDLETVRFSDTESASAFHRYFATHPADRIWLRFRARLQPGQLPDTPFAPAQPVTLAFGFTQSRSLAIWDAASSSWMHHSVSADAREWNDYVLHLDYRARTATFLLNGTLIAADIPHATGLISTFSRFHALREALETAATHDFELDHITLSTAEPPGLDFSGDGMTNAEKRALGLDPHLNDNSGDGFPDVWLIAHGLNPLTQHDPNIDLDGDGLTLAFEFANGLSPNHIDDRVPGFVTMERWNNLAGRTIANLTNASPFSQDPNQRQLLVQIATDQNQGNNYGTRIRGYIVPTETGYHHVYLASDDDGEFWLSPTDSPFDRKRLAFVIGRTGFNQFNKFPSQTAAPVLLQAGEHYYFEVLQKEASGNDFVHVAWTRPGTTSIQTVGAAHLAYFAPRADDPAGDGLPAAWKTAHGLNPSLRHGPHGAYGDFDNDGLSNLEEYQLGTHPALMDSSGDGIFDAEHALFLGADAGTRLEKITLPALPAALAHAVTGDWITDGGGLYAAEGRGRMHLTLEIPEAGIYELTVNTHARGLVSASRSYDYAVYIGGDFLRRITAPPGEGAYQGKLLSPWLDPGSHTLSIDIENTLTGRQIQVNHIGIARVKSVTLDENGEDPWALALLRSRNGLETEIPVSHVSPLSLEGRARYLSMLTVQEGALTAQPAPDERFFLDVPLDPAAPTPVNLRFENGGISETVELTWTPHLLGDEAETLILRAGDTLQLVWDSPDIPPGPVTYKLDGELLAVHNDNQPLFLLAEQAGLRQLTAAAVTPQGPLERTLTLDVRAADLGEDLYVLATASRLWTPPVLEAGHFLEADSRLYFIETPANPRTFAVRSRVPEARYTAARTHGNEPGDGPILDTAAIRGLRVASNSDVHARQEYVYSDGTQLISVGIVLNHVPADIRIEVRIFVGGVTFTDGSLVKILTADDFDQYGRARFEFLKSPQVKNSVCHRLNIYLGNDYLGQN